LYFRLNFSWEHNSNMLENIASESANNKRTSSAEEGLAGFGAMNIALSTPVDAPQGDYMVMGGSKRVQAFS